MEHEALLKDNAYILGITLSKYAEKGGQKVMELATEIAKLNPDIELQDIFNAAFREGLDVNKRIDELKKLAKEATTKHKGLER